MAYCDSPQDLFASEDSDSDATVDLSVTSSTELRLPAVDSESMRFAGKQYAKQRSSRERSRHTISSSDSEGDNNDIAYEPSKVNECPLRNSSNDCAGENGAAEALSSGKNIAHNADKHGVCSQQPDTSASDDRPLCKYGDKCYRRNPSHFHEFRHPGRFIFRRGYIYGAVKEHREAMFTAAAQSLDGAKPNTNSKTNPNPNTT